MASGAPPGSAIQSSENDSASTPLSWEGDKMFHIYIHDYCSKRGYTKTARELVIEADIPQDSQPPINAKQGLLFEWWSVFWTLFTAKNNGQGPDEALLYTQHQVNQNAIRQQNRNQPQQPINRIMPGMTRQPGSMPPNGQLPNGLGPAGMNGGQVGIPNGIQGHMGFPMPNPSGHAPNGLSSGVSGGPPQPHNMPQMMPGQRPLGVGPQGQQNPAGMGQMGPGQHAAQMNRAMLPPNGPPNIGNPMNSTQQAHSPGYQQMGRPSSRPNTPGNQNMMTNPSPSMAPRVPPPNGMVPQMIQDVQAEFMRIPAAFYDQIKQEAGLGDKDATSLTPEEKQRVIYIFRQKSRQGKQNPQGSNVAGPSSTPSMQPAILRNAQGRTAKRSSTSPGEEPESNNRTEGSPPEKKRLRPSPSGGEHPVPPGQSQQQVPQPLKSSQPLPMAPMAPFNHPQGGPGPQMQGMVRMAGAPMNFPHQQQGMNIPMNQGMMPSMGSPGMMSHPVPNLINNSQLTPQMQNYRQSMHNLHKTHIPPGALGNLIPVNAASPQSNSQQQQGGAPQFGSGNMNAGGSSKTVGSMMPPPSPGMNKAQQPNTGKDGPVNPDSNNRPESSPQTPSMGQPGGQGQGGGPPQQQQQPPQSQQQQSSGQQSAGPGTAPPTPVSNPGAAGMVTEPPSGLLGNNSQQTGSTVGSIGPDNMFPPDFLREMVGFEGGFLGGEAGDINFERDFGQWFNPDEMQLT